MSISCSALFVLAAENDSHCSGSMILHTNTHMKCTHKHHTCDCELLSPCGAYIVMKLVEIFTAIYIRAWHALHNEHLATI